MPSEAGEYRVSLVLKLDSVTKEQAYRFAQEWEESIQPEIQYDGRIHLIGSVVRSLNRGNHGD